MSSTTMTMTVPVLPPISLSTVVPCCPNCGTDLSRASPAGTLPAPSENPAAAQAQIDALQAQVRLLNAKATAAVDRWSDYEDELARLRKELVAARKQRRDDQQAQPQPPQRRRSSSSSGGGGGGDGGGGGGSRTPAPRTPPAGGRDPTTPATTTTMSSPGVGFAAAATSRITSLLSRKATPTLKPLPGPGAAHSPSGLLLLPPPPTPPRSHEDLLHALTREQQLRLAAEAKVNDSSREVEELSVSLFEEANEMVATERREKARLEARVGELEQRDRDKKARLERLESAMGRIERVQNLLEEKNASQTE